MSFENLRVNGHFRPRLSSSDASPDQSKVAPSLEDVGTGWAGMERTEGLKSTGSIGVNLGGTLNTRRRSRACLSGDGNMLLDTEEDGD